MSDEVQLSAPIGALAAAVVHDGHGGFAIPDAAFVGLCADVFAAPSSSRRAQAEEVLGLIFKYQGLDRERTAPACTQLATLFTLLIGDELGALQQLEQAGVALNTRQLAAVGAQAASLRPLVKTPDGRSPLDIRMGRKPGAQ